jgi:PadR family transcriptional regulator, regulatory protein PadR
MKRTYLGEFEEIVLLTILILDKGAYGVAITHQIIEQTKRSVRLNQVHAALHRLEDKGMLSSKMGEATPERGGRRKRLFTLTPYGELALVEVQVVRNHLLSLLPRPLKLSTSI